MQEKAFIPREVAELIVLLFFLLFQNIVKSHVRWLVRHAVAVLYILRGRGKQVDEKER